MKLLSTRNINALLAIIAASVLLLFLFSYSETGSPPQFTSQTNKIQYPDYYLVNTNTRLYDKQGILDSTITSERTEHKPKNDSALLREPRLQLYTEGMPDWHISAQSGELLDRGNEVVLNQRVVVLSADQQTSLKTPQLRIFPNQQLAKTDKPVTLLNTNGFTRSIGLEADFKQKTIVLLSDVKGQYKPEVILDDVE